MKHTILFFSLLTTLTACMVNEKISSNDTKIEEKYTAIGTFKVSQTVIKDANNNSYKVFYPSQMTGKMPVITWGNGTGQSPDTYVRTFNHLASWGFIVIDNYEKSTIDGSSILESAKVLVRENSNPRSVFYQKVDIERIGASGHSQGAGGVVNAYKNYSDGKIIKTIVPLAFPSILKPTGTDVKVPIFFVSGERDDFFSSLKYNRQSFDQVPSSTPAAIGARRGALHELLTNEDLVIGYLTAWMRFQLMGDQQASNAFRGSSPEISANPNWNHVATKNIR